MPKCPKCRHSFRVPEDEQDMHDCPSCGYTGHETKPRIRYSINLWIETDFEDEDVFPPTQRLMTAIEKDIILHLEKQKFGKVDCEIVDTNMVD